MRRKRQITNDSIKNSKERKNALSRADMMLKDRTEDEYPCQSHTKEVIQKKTKQKKAIQKRTMQEKST